MHFAIAFRPADCPVTSTRAKFLDRSQFCGSNDGRQTYCRTRTGSWRTRKLWNREQLCRRATRWKTQGRSRCTENRDGNCWISAMKRSATKTNDLDVVSSDTAIWWHLIAHFYLVLMKVVTNRSRFTMDIGTMNAEEERLNICLANSRLLW